MKIQEEKQQLLTIRLEMAFAGFVLDQLKTKKSHRFFERVDVYAGEMSARWAKEFGNTKTALDIVSGHSVREIAIACSGLAEHGLFVILGEARRITGWDEEGTCKNRENIVVIG